MWFPVIVSLAVVISALGQEFASECPSPNGYFADAVQCDKYYECVDDVLTEKVCPDGMAFNDLNPRIEKCDFLFQIDCAERPELQPAQPTDVCPRQNGYFPMADETNCHQFHYCTSGVGNLITCPDGLVFSLKTGTCVWPEAAGRTNCASEKVLNFTCPAVGLDAIEAHPRYSDPTDCQYFYVCINGKTPRRNGCSFGQVFNSKIGSCTTPLEVPECADYYSEYFENYFATLGDETGKISGDIVAAAISAGFNVPTLTNRQRIHNPSSTRRRVTPKPALDANDPPVLPARTRAPSGQTAETDASPVTRNRPGRRRPNGNESGGIRRRNRVTTTTTTTTTPPPPAPIDDYVYYDDPAYYDDYVAEVAADPVATPAPTPAPEPVTEAPRRRVAPFRRTLIRDRN